MCVHNSQSFLSQPKCLATFHVEFSVRELLSSKDHMTPTVGEYVTDNISCDFAHEDIQKD